MSRRQGPAAGKSGSGQLHLLLQIGSDRPRTAQVPLREQILIGRGNANGQPPDVDLNPFGAGDYGVSRLHAAIHYRDGALFVEDLGSTNGTRINGLAIQPRTLVRLHASDELEFGRLRVVLRLVRAPG